VLGLDGIQWASSSRIGPRASARSSRLTTIGLSRRFLAGSNAAADNYRTGNARRSLHGGLSRTRVQLPPPPPNPTKIHELGGLARNLREPRGLLSLLRQVRSWLVLTEYFQHCVFVLRSVIMNLCSEISDEAASSYRKLFGALMHLEPNDDHNEGRPHPS